MPQGRHRAGSSAGHRRASTGARKEPGGARKAPAEARRASPTRVGAAPVEGRRVAAGHGRPTVLTAIGSGEKLFALLPLALLSAASVAGLATSGASDPAATPAPGDATTAAGPFGQQVVHRQAPDSGTPSARPSFAETESPAVIGDDTAPETVDEQPEALDEPTPSSPRVEAPQEPTNSPTESEQTPAPTESPTPTPEATDDNLITRTEATLQCLASGISALDVAGLADCVEELLGG